MTKYRRWFRELRCDVPGNGRVSVLYTALPHTHRLRRDPAFRARKRKARKRRVDR